jgi:sugar phosphate isomerase/epimerase
MATSLIRTSASITAQYDTVFTPFPGKDFYKALHWVKARGFDAAELFVSDPAVLDSAGIAREVARLGLAVATISTGQAAVRDGLSMTSPDENVRLATRKRLFEAIDFSACLGGPNVTIGLIRGRGGQLPKDAEYGLLKSELEQVANYAARKSITLNVEALNRYECSLLSSSESAYEFIMEMGNPENVGVLYDTFHSNIEDADMISTIARIAHKIVHVHFADSNRRLPGEGHINFPRVLQALKAAGYDGYVSLEVLNHPSAEHIIEFAKIRLDAALGR